ncbi:PH domain-containing protein [Paraburkholderia sp. RL17-373-BIF-A]|uniref:hypothetical protein n=1 Tax=Paraburkholderia sp. RL17-373-BIF-A TaxID=3031629 RepID=UPI0038B6E414
MSSLVTRNTISRAFSLDMREGISSANVAARGGAFGSAGGAKDLILSMLTLGIYSFVKSSIIDQKRAALEEALKQLCEKIAAHPAANSHTVEVDGKTIEFKQDLWLGMNVVNISLVEKGHRSELGNVTGESLWSFKTILASQLGMDISSPHTGSKDVRNAIADNLDRLASVNGFESRAGSKVFFSERRDFVSLETFGDNADAEWCLLRREHGVYDLIMYESAENLLQYRLPHPLTRKNIEEGQIIRGTDMLQHLS